MKALRFLTALFVIGCFAVNTVQSQAVVIKDQVWTLGGGYQSTDDHMVVTPEGDINIWMVWQLPYESGLVPDKGTVQWNLMAVFMYDGVEYHVLGTLTVNANGKAKGVLHWPPEV